MRDVAASRTKATLDIQPAIPFSLDSDPTPITRTTVPIDAAKADTGGETPALGATGVDFVVDGERPERVLAQANEGPRRLQAQRRRVARPGGSGSGADGTACRCSAQQAARSGYFLAGLAAGSTVIATASV
jgi:hypothetical protein